LLNCNYHLVLFYSHVDHLKGIHECFAFLDKKEPTRPNARLNPFGQVPLGTGGKLKAVEILTIIPSFH